MHDSRNIVEFVAMNSSIALNQLSVVIDEKLVNFSKWHCFKVFEKINGFNENIEIYKTLFENIEFKINKKMNKNDSDKIDQSSDEKICKFCYESSGILENVCECKGTNKYIHKECLYDAETLQKTVVKLVTKTVANVG